MDDEQNVSEWGAILDGDGRSWVVFEHGTCVVLAEPEGDLAEQARALLEEWGPVRAGTPFGDFTVSHLTHLPGWIVHCHHPDILTYVSPEELLTPDTPEMFIGLLGRSKRNADATSPRAIHVEDRRVT